jgi:hypothetical protein
MIDAPVGWTIRQQLADQTVTTVPVTGGLGDLGAAATQPGGVVNLWYFTVKIKIKALVGTATFNFEVADDTAFATNRRMISGSQTQTAGVLGTIFMDGWVDQEAATAPRYWRVVATFGTSGTFDVEVNATTVI